MKKTDGEKIAYVLNPEGTIAAALWRKMVARKIDRLVARRQAEAWDECCEAWVAGGIPNATSRDFMKRAIRSNPYRKGKGGKR